jgi:hypothetical protein
MAVTINNLGVGYRTTKDAINRLNDELRRHIESGKGPVSHEWLINARSVLVDLAGRNALGESVPDGIAYWRRAYNPAGRSDPDRAGAQYVGSLLDKVEAAAR